MAIRNSNIQEYILEAKTGEIWREILRGTTLQEGVKYEKKREPMLGNIKILDFPPVTARQVRLNILKSKGSPSMVEFEVYAPAIKP